MSLSATFWTSLLIMLVGVIGTFIPLLPGIPLIMAAMVFYGWVEGWHAMSPGFLAGALLVTLFSLVADYAVAFWQHRRSQSDPWALKGAVIGSLFGLFTLGPVGFLLGLLLGAFLGEWFTRKDPQKALRATWSMSLAFLGGALFRIFLAVSLVLAFIFRVLTA